MKTVIIGIIRNEADIIESFVRYNMGIADRMIIIDHRSVDGSTEILQSLVKEGLPVELIEEKSVEFQQGASLTNIMERAFRKYDADWVIPLDADEFLSAKDGFRIKDIVALLPQNEIVKVPWRTYVPISSDDYQERDILRRIKNYRRVEGSNLHMHKIMIPRFLAMNHKGRIASGNHAFVKKKWGKYKEFPYVVNDELVLAHFPIRSAHQVIAKAFVGWLSCLSKPNKQPTENFHLKLLYDRIMNNDAIGPDDLMTLALNYARDPSMSKPSNADFVYKPLRVAPMDAYSIRYDSLSMENHVRILLHVAEEYAEELASLRRDILKLRSQNIVKRFFNFAKL